MDIKGFFILALIGGGVFFFLVVADRVKRSNDGKQFLAAQGVGLDYYYKNVLGISRSASKVFVNVGAPKLIDIADVRSVEKNSIFQTKRNGYGMQFHSQKGCNLAIHTNSIDEPVIVVPFDEAKEMELWYARLGAFCRLA